MADSTPTFSNRALPPQNIDAEESILGGILLDPEAMGRVVDILVVNAFYVQAHRDIYKGLLILHAQGKPTDLMTLSAWLKDQNLLEKIGGTTKLVQIVDRTISAVNVDRYAQLVMEKYVRRQLIAGGHEIVDLGFDTTKPLEEVLDESEQKIFRLTQERPQEGLTPIAETIVETFNNIEEQHQDLAMPGLSCGFYDLDAMTSGFQRSDLVIIAGRPAMGKTSFALNVAINIAKVHQLPVAVFSLEMSKEQLVQRLLAGEAQIESNRLRSGRLTQTDMEPLIMAVESLSNVPLFLDDTANLTVAQMRSQARKLQAEQGGKLGLILIDYLQLMEGSSDNRVQELSKITRSLKGLARELNVPIIALSQLSRGVEARTNKRPMMSDLRESGCLTGDTLITLADSGKQVPLRSCVGQSGFKVWALNETTMQLERATVSKAFSTGIKPVYRLTTRLGRTIRATANHQFLSFLGWRRLDELAVGDRLALPRTIPTAKTQTLSNDQWALIGHLIGDGCTLPRHSIQYTSKELDLAELVAQLSQRIFGAAIQPRIVRERQWYQVYLSATQHLTHNVRNPIAEWFDSLGIFGLRSHEKHVPDLLFGESLAAIATFLRHLWSTDGCLNFQSYPKPRITTYYASSSYQLAQEVQSLLLRFQINARLKRIPQTKGKDNYHVVITGKQDLEIFLQQIGVVGERRTLAKQMIQNHLNTIQHNTNRDIIPLSAWHTYAVPAMISQGITTRTMQAQLEMSYCGTTLYQSNLSRQRALKVAQVVHSPELTTLAQSDIYWDEIISIEADGIEEVFDLTVPSLHNFVANNIVVHNSIEQDADLIIMLYRDSYYNPDSPDRDLAEVIITKHRNGPTGTVKLIFQPELTKFLNLANSGNSYAEVY